MKKPQTRQEKIDAEIRRQNRQWKRATPEQKREIEKKILDKIIRQEQRAIKRRNERFAKATKPQQRAMIAQDVVERIHAGQFSATPGCYIDSVSLGQHGRERFVTGLAGVGGKQFQDFLLKGEACQVCGLGGLMASAVVFRNKATVQDVFNQCKDVRLRLKNPKRALPGGINRIFSYEQLAMIETAFEIGRHGTMDEYYSKLGSKVYHKAQAFGERQADPDPRLLEIMSNIVKNKGTFVP